MSKKICITFTGGLGAQLLSAAAYFCLQKQGYVVSGDTSYFDQAYSEAALGSGQCSIWNWELDHYGFSRADFPSSSMTQDREIVGDGKKKIALGFEGLSTPDIQQKFPVGEKVLAHKQGLFQDQPYICLHVRRGDYLNVATLVVSDQALFRAVSKVSRLAPHLLVISDSPLSAEMTNMLESLPVHLRVMIGGDPFLVHGLMRLSSVLICSNSQFSMSAAALRDEFSLTLCPAKHEGGQQSEVNSYLADIREFQLMSQFPAFGTLPPSRPPARGVRRALQKIAHKLLD